MQSTNVKGICDRGGTITIAWDSKYKQLLSPSGDMHLLPCEGCGTCGWVGLRNVSYCCPECYSEPQESRVRLVRETASHCWTLVYLSGPACDRIRLLFGTSILPLPLGASVSEEQAVAHVRRCQPDLVIVNRPEVEGA